MRIIKPYKIVEIGKDKPFKWNGKKMNFVSKIAAKNILRDIKKDFSYLDLEIKEVYDIEFMRILAKKRNYMVSDDFFKKSVKLKAKN